MFIKHNNFPLRYNVGNIFWNDPFSVDDNPQNEEKEREVVSKSSEYDPKVKNTLTKDQILEIFCSDE